MERIIKFFKKGIAYKHPLNNRHFTNSQVSKYFCEDLAMDSKTNKIQSKINHSYLHLINPPKFKTNLSQDYETAKKQIFWRIRNLGQLELEFIVFKWYEANQKDLSVQDLKKFSEEVLEMENPDLNKYLVNMLPADPSFIYINKIQNFIR